MGFKTAATGMNRIFVISAPSGTGKTTIALRLKEAVDGLHVPVTYTTKQPRSEEVDGRDYHFVSREKFLRMVKSGDFAEWAEVYGNYYGTPKKEISEKSKQGKTILLTIDTQGGLNMKKLFPETVLIGLLPPSMSEQENRIRKRSSLSETQIQERMDAARKERKVLFAHYDYRIVNKNLDATVEKIAQIIKKKK